MLVWPYCRSIDERSHGDVNVSAVSNDEINQRSAYFAMRVVAIVFAEGHEILLPFYKDQLLTFDTRERLERRTCRPTTIGAMTIGCIQKLVWYRIRNGAAETSSRKYPSTHLLRLFRKLLLAAPEASFVTGHILSVDGGKST